MSEEAKVPPGEPAPAPATPPKEKGAAASVPIEQKGIVLRNLEDLLRFGRTIVEAGAAPSWAFGERDEDKRREPSALSRAAGACAIAIQAGLEHGLGYLGGLQAFVVLDGHITWRGQAAAAKIRNSGVCRPGTLRFWSEGEGEQRRGVATAHRVGYAEPDTRIFTFAMARQANLLGKFNWKSYPDRMFMWRAMSWLATDVFSDVLGGFPLHEDLQDREPAPREPAARRVERLPPPAQPDPLYAALGLKQPASPPVEAVGSRAIPAPAPPADAPPPFSSHEEADRAIAEDEQRGLFGEER